MPPTRADYEQRFYIALKRILAYMTPDQLRRQSERTYGLSFEEALEMSYENLQNEAIAALTGYRRPRRKPAPKPETAALVTDKEHQ